MFFNGIWCHEISWCVSLLKGHTCDCTVDCCIMAAGMFCDLINIVAYHPVRLTAHRCLA